MSSDLFHLEVLKKTANTALIEVTDVHHDISAPDTNAFFFAAIHEAAQGKSHPLARACSPDEMCDEEFVLANTPTYLAGVEVVAARSMARATYRVRFTDSRWGEHLRRGLTWGSPSYDIGDPTLRPDLEALAAVAKKSAKPEPPPPVAQAGPRTCRVTVMCTNGSGKSADLRVKVITPEAPPPVTAAFFFRALREELSRSDNTALHTALRKLCPDDAVADDAIVAAAAKKLVADLTLFGWYGVGRSTFLYRVTFPSKKWGEALSFNATWKTRARDAGPAVLERALARMTGVKTSSAGATKKASKKSWSPPRKARVA